MRETNPFSEPLTLLRALASMRGRKGLVGIGVGYRVGEAGELNADIHVGSCLVWSIPSAYCCAQPAVVVSHSPSHTVQFSMVLYSGLNARRKRQDGASSVLSEPDLRRRLRLEA
jgi:hypothetical protein